MRTTLRVAGAAARVQALSLLRSPATAILVFILPVNLLLLMSLFALTGYNAPTGLVLEEDTPRAHAFVDSLRDAYHSFDLRPMDRAQADRLLRRGRIVAAVEIPRGFDALVGSGRTALVRFTVDNVNLDMAEDVRRAFPAAVSIFATRLSLPAISVRPRLTDMLAQDTGYIAYLAASSIALAAVIAGAILGGLVTAREWEAGTARLMRLAPCGLGPVLIGRLAAAAGWAALASSVSALVVVFGFRVPAAHPIELAGGIVFTVVAAAALGGLVGVLLRRTLPITPLILGITLPFYLDSGALEPQRFDGKVLFWLSHLSPAYYGVGIMEHACHGLIVTPEPLWSLYAVLALVAASATLLVGKLARR